MGENRPLHSSGKPLEKQKVLSLREQTAFFEVFCVSVCNVCVDAFMRLRVV